MRVVLHKILVRERFKLKRAYYLGFGYLKAYLNKYAPDIEVVIAAEANQILAEKPDMVGLSAVTKMWPLTVDLIRKLRQDFDGPIIVGGPHISALARCLPREADLAIVGEGEATFLDVVRRHLVGSRWDEPPIPGTGFWNAKGEVTMAPPRPMLQMDQLPLPDQEGDGEGLFALSTARGCPYRCVHCVQNKLSPRVRQLSAKSLVDALVWYHETRGATRFEFLDDLFVAFPKRLFEFRDTLRSRGLIGKFEFLRVSLCAHLITEEVVAALCDIGVKNCGMGVESAHPRILREFKNGVVSVEHLENAIHLAHKHRLNLGGSLVLGYPGEQEHEMRTTIDFFKRARDRYGFHLWTAYVCQPLPPSDLWVRGVKEGKLSENMDFSMLRIDADIAHFDSPWFYGNEEGVPRERFIEIIEQEGLSGPGRFRPMPQQREGFIRRAARRLLRPIRRIRPDRP